MFYNETREEDYSANNKSSKVFKKPPLSVVNTTHIHRMSHATRYVENRYVSDRHTIHSTRLMTTNDIISIRLFVASRPHRHADVSIVVIGRYVSSTSEYCSVDRDTYTVLVDRLQGFESGFGSDPLNGLRLDKIRAPVSAVIKLRYSSELMPSQWTSRKSLKALIPSSSHDVEPPYADCGATSIST